MGDDKARGTFTSGRVEAEAMPAPASRNPKHEFVCVAEGSAGNARDKILDERRNQWGHELTFAIQKRHWLCHRTGGGGGQSMELRNYSTAGFDRGAPVWKEALWWAVKCLVFQTAWPWPSSVRVALLRAFGGRIGQRVVVRGNVNISFPWRLSIGDDVWLGEEVMILSLAAVTIESDVCISQRTFLCTGTHDFRSPTFELLVKPITIRRGCWLAAQVFVAPGIEIGQGSMVCAGAVVVTNVPARAIVQGNPATVVKILE